MRRQRRWQRRWQWTAIGALALTAGLGCGDQTAPAGAGGRPAFDVDRTACAQLGFDTDTLFAGAPGGSPATGVKMPQDSALSLASNLCQSPAIPAADAYADFMLLAYSRGGLQDPDPTDATVSTESVLQEALDLAYKIAGGATAPQLPTGLPAGSALARVTPAAGGTVFTTDALTGAPLAAIEVPAGAVSAPTLAIISPAAITSPLFGLKGEEGPAYDFRLATSTPLLAPVRVGIVQGNDGGVATSDLRLVHTVGGALQMLAREDCPSLLVTAVTFGMRPAEAAPQGFFAGVARLLAPEPLHAATAAAAALATGGCVGGRPSTFSNFRAVAVTSQPATPDLVKFTNDCGTSFRIRNYNADYALVRWTNLATGRSGELSAAPRAGNKPYGETFFDSGAPGTVTLELLGKGAVGQKTASGGSCS